MTQQDRRIGFIGLGRMGAPMATHLAAAGFEVVGHDPYLADPTPLTDAGVTVAERLDALRDTSMSISMLPTPASAEEALLGDSGLFGMVGPGHLHLHMGTAGPGSVRTLASRARALGVEVLDAPVSGSVPAAVAATLTSMVGGPTVGYERALPALRAMTRAQTHVGKVGDGSVIKLGVNSVVTLLNQAVAEALELVRVAGADEAVFYDLLEESVAGAPYVKYKREVYLDPEHAPVAAAMTVLNKDLGLARELAASHGRTFELFDTASRALADASAHGEDHLDVGEIVRAVRRSSSTPRP